MGHSSENRLPNTSRRCLLSIVAALVFGADIVHAGIGCTVGGYSDYPDPVLVLFQDKVLLGGSRHPTPDERRELGRDGKLTSLRVYHLKAKSISPQIMAAGDLRFGVRVGSATREMAWVGGPDGAARSGDLFRWEMIPALEGKNVGSIAVHGEEVWIGGEGIIYQMADARIARRHVVGEGLVVNLIAQEGGLRFNLIQETPPPAGYCTPYLTSSGRLNLDLATGSVSPPPPEQSAKEVPATPSPHELDALEHFYKAQDQLIYFPFWNRLVESLAKAGESERLKRMFSGANDRGKRTVLQYGLRGDEGTANEILKLAVEGRAYLREDLVHAIDRRGDESAVTLLTRVLKEGATETLDPTERSRPQACASGAAADALLRRSGDSAVPLIESIMEAHSTDSRVRESLRHRLSNWHRSSKKRAYHPPRLRKAEGASGSQAIEMLDDPDGEVRFQALQRLQLAPDSIPFEKLAGLLADAGHTGALAAKILGYSKNPMARDALLGALNSPATPVRVWAMISLGRLREVRAYSALIAGLKDSNRDIQSGASEGLGLLGELDALGPLIEVIGRRGPRYDYAVENSIEALGRLGDLRAVPIILDATTSEHSGYRKEAVKALGEIKAKAAVPALIQTLQDSDSQVRLEAIWALGKIGETSAIEPLENLKEPDSFNRSAIKHSIRKLRERRSQ